MRSLYWLVALTLIAAAATTWAILDSSGKRAAAPEPVLADEFPPEEECVIPARGGTSTANARAPHASPPDKPANPLPPDDPDLRLMREASLGQLEIMKPTPPHIPPYTGGKGGVVTPQTPTRLASSVPDEFSFPGTEPASPRVIPPAASTPPSLAWQGGERGGATCFAAEPGVASSVAQAGSHADTPAIPSAKTDHKPAELPSFTEMPEFQPGGAEVVPGLHAAGRHNKPQEDLFANPVRDTLWAVVELANLLHPATYLSHVSSKTSRPISPVTRNGERLPDSLMPQDANLPVEGGLVRWAPPSTQGGDEKDCKGDDGVVVRTYSIADFLTPAQANPDEIIRLVTQMVAPESWMMRDGHIEYFSPGKCLVVRHRAGVHVQIDDLFGQLRSAVRDQTTMMPASHVAAAPVVEHDPAFVQPARCELAPMPSDQPRGITPRVVTLEPGQAPDDDYFGLPPMTVGGRLVPIPTLRSGLTDTSLLPAQYDAAKGAGRSPLAAPGVPTVETGHGAVPGYFPMFLPFAPMPSPGPPQGAAKPPLPNLPLVNPSERPTPKD
jgi:hypothetical protein